MQKVIYELEFVPGVVPESLKKKPETADLQEVFDPALTVLTISFNTAQFLEDTIRSVANQSFRNFEHIVIDGGSTDQTIEILKSYPHIKWISEKDSGYPEGFRKGIKMARGKYVTQCAVSDAYANKNWLKYCVEFLDANNDVSLVWGLPQHLSETGVAGLVPEPNFAFSRLPVREDFFTYALKVNGSFPEGNLCVRKQVLEKCYPQNEYNNIVDWNEFSINFQRAGYLSYFLPIAANFGRTHKGQLGQKLKQSGQLAQMARNFKKAYNNFRWGLILGKERVRFVDGNSRPLGTEFNGKKFFWEYMFYKFSWGNISSKLKFYFYIATRIPHKLKQLLSKMS